MSDISTFGRDHPTKAIAALGAAERPDSADIPRWQSHPVDIGFSLFGMYVRLIAGRERRSPHRREQERAVRPLGTIGNMLFAGSLSGVVLTVLIVVALVYSSVLSE